MITELRIGVFVSAFPCVTETFIIRQVATLASRGHKVKVFAHHGLYLDDAHPELASLNEAEHIFAFPVDSVERWRRIFLAFVKEPDGWLRAVNVLQKDLNHLGTISGGDGLAITRHYRNLGSLVGGGILTTFGALQKRDLPFDIVHAHFGDIGRVVAALKHGFQWPMPLVVTFHGSDANVLGRRMPLSFYKPVFEHAAVITYGTPFLRQRLLELGAPESKLRANPMGVPLDSFPFRKRSLESNEPLRLLSVGRLIVAKGHHVAIRAVEELHKQGVPVRYDIVGAGPERERLQTLIMSLGLTQIVSLHGAKDGADVRRFYRDAHVFVHPSISDSKGTVEQQSVVMVEAQATGLPVVASHIGGVSSTMIHEGSGFLIDEADHVEMASAILRIRSTYNIIEYGRVGRAHVERHFSHESCMNRLIEIYRECIESA